MPIRISRVSSHCFFYIPFFIFDVSVTFNMEVTMAAILFFIPSLKKYEGNIISPMVEKLGQFGSVSIIETDHRSAASDAYGISKRRNGKSGISLRRTATPTPGFYKGVNDDTHKPKTGTFYEQFVREIRTADCVIADLTLGSLQMGFLIALAVAEGTPLLCINQRLTFISQSRFELFKDMPEIHLVEFSSENELDSILQQFMIRVGVAHAI